MVKDYLTMLGVFKYECSCVNFPKRLINKRTMMALNHSPEFKNSNPNFRAAELFGTCGHHLSKLRRTQLCNPLE